MNKKQAFGAGACLALLAGMAARCQTPSLPLTPSPREASEIFLRAAQIKAIDREPQHGRMSAWLVTLSDGTTSHRALFKFIRRNRPALMPDSYAYELAAYELDGLLGLELMPPTVERTIEERTGSLQVFLEDVESENPA